MYDFLSNEDVWPVIMSREQLDMFLIADKQYWIWNQNVLMHVCHQFSIDSQLQFFGLACRCHSVWPMLITGQQHTDLPWNGRREPKEAAFKMNAIIMGFINTNMWKRTYERSLCSFVPNCTFRFVTGQKEKLNFKRMGFFFLQPHHSPHF